MLAIQSYYSITGLYFLTSLMESYYILRFAWIAGKFWCGDLIILLRCVYYIGSFQAKLITATIYPCLADGRRRGYKLHAYSLQSFAFVSDKRSAWFLTFEKIPIVLIASRYFTGTMSSVKYSSSEKQRELIRFFCDRVGLMASDKRLTTVGSTPLLSLPCRQI